MLRKRLLTLRVQLRGGSPTNDRPSVPGSSYEAAVRRATLPLRDTARAMSRENVEIVRAAIGAWNRGDWDATLKDGAPSFEFDFSRSVGPNQGVYGLDQMQDF